ncbi:unknown [Clostridium sp. CAG:81]|nr:unknown [Clostridium sp. CAG:81]
MHGLLEVDGIEDFNAIRLIDHFAVFVLYGLIDRIAVPVLYRLMVLAQLGTHFRCTALEHFAALHQNRTFGVCHHIGAVHLHQNRIAVPVLYWLMVLAQLGTHFRCTALEHFTALHQDSAFGVCHHIGAVHLHQVGFQPEAGLTGTGAADDQHIFVSGSLGVFRAAVHGQALGFRQNHIVLENRVYIRGDVLVCSPAGGTILHAVAVFLRIFAFQIYRQPQTTTAADSHQQVQRV